MWPECFIIKFDLFELTNNYYKIIYYTLMSEDMCGNALVNDKLGLPTLGMIVPRNYSIDYALWNKRVVILFSTYFKWNMSGSFSSSVS